MSATQLSEQQLEDKRDLMARGDQAYDDGDYTLALDHYHRASIIDSHDPAVWCALGMSYYGLDFNREAWRSYLLALHCDPRRPDTLWYAAEFLDGVGDAQLAASLLTTYLQVEQDPERQAQGREFLLEVLERRGGEPLSEEQRSEVERALLELSQQAEAGAEASEAAEGGEPAAAASTEGAVDTAPQLHSEEAGEAAGAEEEAAADDEYYEEDGSFVASLSLQLQGFGGLCEHCKTSIPYDAPYCHLCLMPHFYEEV